MAWSLDTKGQSTQQSTNPVTYNYTCGSGTRLLVICIQNGSSSYRTGGAPTYNSLPMLVLSTGTLIGSGENYTEMYYLVNPPTGSSYTISVPNTGGATLQIDALSFKNGKSSASVSGLMTASGSTANPSVNLDVGVSNSLVVSSIAHAYRSAPTSGSGYTLGYNVDWGNWVNADEYDLDSGNAGNVAVQYTVAADAWGLVAASFMETDKAPVVIDTNGIITEKIGGVVVTSSGSIYAFYARTGSNAIGIKKSGDGGATWTALTDVTATTIFGTNYTIESFQIAIGGDGYIHAFAMDTYVDPTRTISYSRLNTATDTWDSWVEPLAYSNTAMPTAKWTSISVDQDNYPHILYNEYASPWDPLQYANKRSGSWVKTSIYEPNADMTYGRILCHHGRVLLAYAGYSGGSAFGKTYDIGNNQWSETTVRTGSGNYLLSSRPTLALSADSSGSGYIYTPNNTSNSYIYENGVQIGSITIAAYQYSVVSLNDVRYVFYIDYPSNRLKFISNDGSGWSTPATLQYGLITAPVAVSSYYYLNQEGKLGYLFTQSGGVWYDYYQLSSLKTSKHAYIKGGETVSGVAHAYLNSGTYVAGTQHAYIRGAYDALLPDGDVSHSGVWQNELGSETNLFQSIDEFPLPDDNDFITEAPAINNDYYESRLADPIGPIGAGTIGVKWRGCNRTSGSIAARVQLRQGSSTVIASRDQVLPADPTTFSFDLSSGERANITDPTDLRLRFIVLR